MDEIETGFAKIIEKIEELKKTEGILADNVRANDAKLLGRMADSAIPIVKSVGIKMLKKGKQDTKGEIYDPQYFPQKMIILGKAETAGFRPDNPEMKVTDQFCVLTEDGDFFELMYSFDGFLTDSYLNPLDPKKAIDEYGYDIIFMLYSALHDYLKGEEDLVRALDKVVGYIFARSP
ncbi:MAG TPA: hypothetical protein VLL74_02450 [Methanoregula sp.]|nr:hypothetical protein [Methanoregula sp.]